jgi:hypothetical protein
LPTLVKVAQQAKIKLHRGRKKLQFAGWFPSQLA